MTESTDPIRPVKVLIGPATERARLMADTDDLLKGIDAEVLTYGVFTEMEGVVSRVANRSMFVRVPSGGPICYGAAACANFGLSLAFRPRSPYQTAALFTPDFDPSRPVCAEAVHAIGELAAPNMGLVWWLSSGVMHVSASLVEQIGYPDPSLPDRVFAHDYALRALGAGFTPIYGGMEPPPDDVVACLDARYPGYGEAAYMGTTAMRDFAVGKVSRIFVGAIAGLVDLDMYHALLEGDDTAMDSSAPFFARFRAYVSQAFRLTE